MQEPKGADFRAPARSPTPAHRPRFPPVEPEDPDVDALANGGWYKAAARTSASRPARLGLATTRKLLRGCQMGVSSASRSVLPRAASPPLRIAFVPDRRTARDCIGNDPIFQVSASPEFDRAVLVAGARARPSSPEIREYRR